MRVQPSVSPEEFWSSTEPHTFRVNSTPYAEVHKFKIWILGKIEEMQSKKSFEQQSFDRYGDIDLMDDFDTDYKLDNSSPLFKYSRADVNKSNKKWKPRTELDKKFVTGIHLEDQYLIKD